MSDSLVILGDFSANGKTIFAKNSNRNPNEPQVIVYIPSRKHDYEFVRTENLHIPQAKRTNAMLLSKPSRIWGAEMGVNEHGVAIGNGAVFTREKVQPGGLLGTDLLRLALERSSSADQALEIIVSLISEYGQGGNYVYKRLPKCHSAFIICDRSKAWILETADIYWVAEEVTSFASLSSCLTIGNDFSLSHPEVVRNAVKKKWCNSEDDFKFDRAYSHNLLTSLSGGRQRIARSIELLERGSRQELSSVVRILRDHGYNLRPEKGSMKSICAHAHPPVPIQTTCSMICEIDEELLSWVTGTSCPCISLFKPVWFDGNWCTLPYKDQSVAENHWKHWERFIRSSVFKFTNAELLFDRFARPLQESLFQQTSTLHPDTKSSDPAILERITHRAFDQSWKVSDRLMLELAKQQKDLRSPIMSFYWRLLNNRLFGKKKSLFTKL